MTDENVEGNTGQLTDSARHALQAEMATRPNMDVMERLAGREGYVIPDSPDPMVRSVYLLTEDGIWWEHPAPRGGADAPPVRDLLASRPFLVRQRLRDDRDESRYVLAWLSDDDEVKTITVPAATLADSRRLVSAFPEVVVTSRNAAQCIEYVAQCLRENRAWLVEYGESVATALGWPLTGTTHFVSGPGRPRPVEDVKNTGLWLEGHRTEGTLDGWRQTVDGVKDRRLVQLMVNASLAAPLLRPLRQHSFAVDLSGTTSGGKTISLRAAASVWGDPNAILVTCKDSKASIEHHLSVLRGMPLFLDETQLAKPEDLEDVVYGLTEGRSKGRSRQDGSGLQNTDRLESVMMTTGEQTLVSMTKKAGIVPRVVTATGQPCVTKEQADELKEAVSRDYGHAGPLLAETVRQLPLDELLARYWTWKERLAAGADSPISGRRADSVGVLALANEIGAEMGLVPRMAGEIWEWLVNGGDATLDDEGDRPQQALNAALSWAVSRQKQFFSLVDEGGILTRFEPSTGWLGRWDHNGDFIGFRPSELERHLTQLGFQPQAIFTEWRARGWLKHSKDTVQGVTKISGKSTRCIIVTHLSQLNEEETQALITAR